MARAKAGWLPDDAYRIVLKYVPIPTVDFVIVRGVDDRQEFLLGKRVEQPYKGSWFTLGGRIPKGERMDAAVRRHLKRELGIVNAPSQFIGCQDVWNPPRMGVRSHSIWHIYLVELQECAEVKPNHENAKVKWFRSINPRWPLPVRQALTRAGFSE